MKRILKIFGFMVLILIGLVLLAAGGIYVVSENVRNTVYDLPKVEVVVPVDAEAAIERGRHLVTVVSDCTGCHGKDLSGGVVVDDPALGKVVAPNLTTGAHGMGSQLSDEDIARVLRYAVMPDGRSAFVMPSDDYSHFSDADLSAVIAYVRSLPPVDNDPGATRWGPLGRFLLATGNLPIIMVKRIDPNIQHVAEIKEEVSREYGAYLANIAGCTGCHGPGLSGGAILGAPPDWPHAANLTPSGEMIGWTEQDFFTALRTGMTPGGRKLNPRMPYETYKNMTDGEIEALWLFIKSVPAKTAGTR